MSIKGKLQEDWKQAMKDRDKFKANTLSTARSAILFVEKTKGIELEDSQIIEILAKEVKQRNEAVLEFQKGNRQDLIDKAKAEIEILLSYLPQQLSKEEIYEIIEQSAVEAGANSIKDMGKLMKLIMPKTAGIADGKLVSTLVRDYLSKK